jgi:hypothetical protein
VDPDGDGSAQIAWRCSRRRQRTVRRVCRSPESEAIPRRRPAWDARDRGGRQRGPGTIAGGDDRSPGAAGVALTVGALSGADALPTVALRAVTSCSAAPPSWPAAPPKARSSALHDRRGHRRRRTSCARGGRLSRVHLPAWKPRTRREPRRFKRPAGARVVLIAEPRRGPLPCRPPGRRGERARAGGNGSHGRCRPRAQGRAEAAGRARPGPRSCSRTRARALVLFLERPRARRLGQAGPGRCGAARTVNPADRRRSRAARRWPRLTSRSRPRASPATGPMPRPRSSRPRSWRPRIRAGGRRGDPRDRKRRRHPAAPARLAPEVDGRHHGA